MCPGECQSNVSADEKACFQLSVDTIKMTKGFEKEWKIVNI